MPAAIPRFLPHIDAMTGYIPGEQPRHGQIVKLNTNENPYPPSPEVLKRLRDAVSADLRKYPDAGTTGTRDRLSGLFGASSDHFVVGNGSDELLNVILRCFAGPGDKVVFPTPTYPYYNKLIDLQNAEPCPVDLAEDFTLNIDDLIQPDARVTLLANPNSPTGIGLSSEAVDELACRVEGLLVIDEAYVDFSREGGIDIARRHDHVLVTRTLSKSFSLAGVRVGFAFGSPRIVAGLWKVKEHYNVSHLSQIAAEAALDDVAWMRQQAKTIIETRRRLSAQLTRRGFHVWDSDANFVLTRVPGGDAGQLYERLKSKGFLVRFFGRQARLGDCLRISIGTDEETDGLLEAIDASVP